MKRVTDLIILMITLLGLAGCSKDLVSPILVLACDSNFGTYTCEILKAEGINGFQIDSLTDRKITLSYLQGFDIVILAESEITPIHKEMLFSYVKDGGNLIAFRPDKKLSEIFGINATHNTIKEGYLQIILGTDIGKGLISVPMQFHGEADGYQIDGGIEIASLFVDSIQNSGMPAIVYNSYGKGHGVAFSYNLPRSIVYTRQGNPDLAGLEKDGIYGIRPMDMFTEGWVKTSNNTINQADEQMRLLTRCIEKMSTYTRPIPRFWYFPDTLKSLVTLTNDGEYMGEDDFESQFRDIDSMGAKMSLYILETKKVSKEWADKWVGRGHEISGHPDATNLSSFPGWYYMKSALTNKKYEIADKYSLSMRTNVNHWFVWCGRDSTGSPDFGSQAALEADIGIKMNISYAHYDNNSVQGHFLGGSTGYSQGNYTGSGLVMKFANCKGRVLDIYQHCNSVYDQAYMEKDDQEGFFNCFKGIIDRSLQDEVYSCISIKAHNVEYFFSRKPLMQMLAYANKHNIPVWTAGKLLEFIEMKDEATFENICWSNDRLLFKIQSSLKHTGGLTCMVPYTYNGKKVSKITIDGLNHPYSVRSVKGFEYAMVTIMPGSAYDIKISYNKL